MGVIAALGTAFFWSLSSLFFTAAGKEVGSLRVNRIRLLFAVTLVMIAHWITEGSLLPVNAGWQRWAWLGLSGIVGLTLGDSFLFQAYVLIGARISTLLMAFAPVMGAVIAWIALGEHLSPLEIAGIVITVAGISIVILDGGNGSGDGKDRKRYLFGILFGLGGALGQAGGLVLAKEGLSGSFPAISGVAIRMLIAMITIWIITLVSGQIPETLKVFKMPKALGNIAGGSIVGPFIGVWLSLVAVQLISVGVGSTLMALTPIIVLPISHYVYKEKVSSRAVIGTVVALVGVAVLTLFS
jgi:drug/metabolite transporter (DMT)-like permease